MNEAVTRGLEAFAAGRMIVLVDDKDRENEGDLVIAAEHCAAADINFMCTHGRGLICLALTAERVDHLELPMMVRKDKGHMGTAFTVSIEAREGVTTGISAPDRARTVRVAVDPDATANDIVSPGHIFPLRAHPGGVLVRSGHTEGAVDLARLAGLRPAGVICEIMRDDGEMARMDDLETFARVHEMPILTIADLIAHRLGAETLVQEVANEPLPAAVLGLSDADGWSVRTFASTVEPIVHYVAFCKGELDTDAAVLLRAQRAQVLGDVFGLGSASGSRLRGALGQIERAGRGVLLYILDQSAQVVGGLKPAEQGFRQFGLGAQVLKAIGLRRITVMTNNPRKIIGLRGFGLEVEGSVPLEEDTP